MERPEVPIFVSLLSSSDLPTTFPPANEKVSNLNPLQALSVSGCSSMMGFFVSWSDNSQQTAVHCDLNESKELAA